MCVSQAFMQEHPAFRMLTSYALNESRHFATRIFLPELANYMKPRPIDFVHRHH
jgi:hypothetical protein